MDIWTTALALLKSISPLEWLGFVFSILQAYLASINKSINYFFALLSASITIYIFTQSQLYAQALLNVYYLVMAVYGYYLWKLKKVDNKERSISRANQRDYLETSILIGVTFLLFCWKFNSGPYYIFDNIISSFAFGGMWLMAKRKLESWVVINISNIISIPILYLTHLKLYMVLGVLLFIIGCNGFIEWNKLLKKERVASS